MMSELLLDRLLGRTHLEREKSHEIFFLSHSRTSHSQRVERSGCRKFNLIADTIFDWQTAREHVCICECNEEKREEERRERERENMNRIECVTSRIVQLRRSFSSPSVPLSCLRFIFRRGFIVRSFADIRNLARQDWTVQCPSKRYIVFFPFES